MSTHLLPAIRAHIGDWSFYTTTLTFRQVASLINSPDEIHERKKLSDWIQREVIEDHKIDISKYINENSQRFLGSLIIGIYGGNPDWAPVDIKSWEANLDLTLEQKNETEGKLGFLYLEGNEKLFAIDGQHRVAGIKHAMETHNDSEDIANESIAAIFVGHKPETEEGKQRTRRLFTTVNKKAKPVSKAATIALDEDNGFAIVTRNIIDSHWLFSDERNHISYTSTGSVPANSETLITSVVGLFEIIKDLHPSKNKKKFESNRPTDNNIKQFSDFCLSFIDTLIDNVDSFKRVFVDQIETANLYRSEDNNYLLFRPIGQRVFARATQVLISRGLPLNQSIEILLRVNMEINSADWHHILWDPINNNMITNKLVIAETRLLTLAGEEAKNQKSFNALQDLLNAI